MSAPLPTAPFRRFSFSSCDDLQAACAGLGLDLPISRDLGVLASPVQVGRHRLGNRFAVQPMEGVDAAEDGGPSELTFRRYRRFAAGGASLIWCEAVAVVEEGRSGARQLLFTRANLPGYRRLVDEIRAEARRAWGHEVMVVVQLTHSGRYSRPGGTPRPVLAQHIPPLDTALNMTAVEPISDEGLDRLVQAFVDAAQLAAEAGFDAVDMKAVHGYLIAELLGARTRPGRYGGSYENRTRFVRDCVSGMRAVLPSAVAVTGRLTVYEPSPFPWGWGVESVDGSVVHDPAEPHRLLGDLVSWGSPLTNVSLGYPRYQPHLNRPHDVPLAGMQPPPEDPLVGVARFAATCRAAQLAVPGVPLISAGLSWLRHLLPEVAAGMVRDGWCGMVGLGRMAFAYPDAPAAILREGRLDPKQVCITCSLCSQIMKDGVGRTGCVVRDKEVYAPELRAGRAKVPA